jgi:monovalent cation/hydrogen antiporter
MSAIKENDCPHLAGTNSEALDVATTSCEECGASAPTRACMTCGHVGCCESSQGHALAHSRSSGHPLIRELPNTDRSFTWCYGCNAYIK